MNSSDDSTGGSALGRLRIRLGGQASGGPNTLVVSLYTITLLLVAFGLFMVLSSSSISSYLSDRGFFGAFWQQATFALIGLPFLIIAARMRIAFWKRWAWPLLGLGILLQVLVFTPIGVEVYGNRNWIQLGPVSAQPSEALKLALIVWIGAILAKKEPLLHDMKHELIPIVLPGAILSLGLVMLGHDLGTAMIMGAAVVGAMYFGGVSGRSLALIAAGALVSVGLFVLTSPNRLARITAAGDDYSGLDWQPLHGTWALAGGGIFGVGLGGSKAKWSWLPEADNDYIFAIIGEELGLIGALLVIAMFVALAIVMLRVIAKTRDRFGRAVVGGILVWIVGQAFVNIGVVTGVFPVLGVPLPLISSGGTALIACLTAMGVVISIARDTTAQDSEPAGAGERIP
ncbi:FtsW/RodA/SpoVE family cell cycle protein [Leucobacter sp. GX24907]